MEENRRQEEEDIAKKREQNKKMKMTIKSNIEAKRAEKQRQINEEAKLLN